MTYHQITIKVTPFEFRLFKQLKDKHKLSARKVLEYSGCACDKCKNVDIVTYDRETGEEILIPRGILSKKIK